jgi:hypothetical protein
MYRSYLQWVGSYNYPFVDDFIKEASTKGVFCKIANVGVALSMIRSPSLVFFAYAPSRGARSTCPACLERVQCPVCARRAVDDLTVCKRCKGLGSIEENTGGVVEVDGARWSYARWLSLRKNPEHGFWQEEHKIGKVLACSTCAGRGWVPYANIVGFFAQTNIVVVSSSYSGTDPSGFKVITTTQANEERPRKTKTKLTPGIYAISEPKSYGFVEQIAKRFNGGVTLHGGFASFDDPLIYQGKIFMSAKKWHHPALEEFGECV